MKWVLAVALALFSTRALCQQSDDWTAEEVAELKSVLYGWMGEPGLQDRAPRMLRLSFHSCVGGCNGCVNMDDPLNAGLDWIVPQIDDLYDSTFPYGPDAKVMSRADFWSLAGIVAVDYSIDIANIDCPELCPKPVDIAFTYGRQDCSPSSTGTTSVDGLPDAFFDHDQTLGFFSDAFGMSEREAVAIMGGHTLGGMHRENSGYRGDWKEEAEPDFTQPYQFNNRFYSFLVDPNFLWTHEDANDLDSKEKTSAKSADQRFQWIGSLPDGRVVSNMLDVDVSLVKEVDIIDEGGQSRCSFDECPPSSTYDIVEEYALDSDAWLRDFVCAYEKMVSSGAADLKTPSGTSRARQDDGLIRCEA